MRWPFAEFQKRTFDVVVLDVMLPNRDGLSVCKTIRQTSDVPILLVTARGEETDHVLGLELGADDYVVKPSLRESSLARVTAYRAPPSRRELLPKTRATSVSGASSPPARR